MVAPWSMLIVKAMILLNHGLLLFLAGLLFFRAYRLSSTREKGKRGRVLTLDKMPNTP